MPDMRCCRMKSLSFTTESGATSPLDHTVIDKPDNAVPMAESVGLDFHSEINASFIPVNTDDSGDMQIDQIGILG